MNTYASIQTQNVTILTISLHLTIVNETSACKKLEHHVATTISKTHLKDLLQDEDRCKGLVVEHDGIHMDYSRQQVLPETMVR